MEGREWWRDTKTYSLNQVSDDSPLLSNRQNLRPAIEFAIKHLDLRQHSAILDLCCGPGRYATELALSGFDVTGIDINPELISLAYRLANREGVAVRYMIGDMRQIPFVEHFDAVINVGTSFGYFDDDDNQMVFDAIATALKPNGIFLLEMGNRDYYLKNFAAKDWQRLEDGRIAIISRTFDLVRGRIDASFSFTKGESGEKYIRSWRAYTLVEIANMLRRSGLTLSKVFGGWDGEDFGVDAERLVAIAKKRSKQE